MVLLLRGLREDVAATIRSAPTADYILLMLNMVRSTRRRRVLIGTDNGDCPRHSARNYAAALGGL
jgi:hypothetical protein